MLLAGCLREVAPQGSDVQIRGRLPAGHDRVPYGMDCSGIDYAYMHACFFVMIPMARQESACKPPADYDGLCGPVDFDVPTAEKEALPSRVLEFIILTTCFELRCAGSGLEMSRSFPLCSRGQSKDEHVGAIIFRDVPVPAGLIS